MLHTPLRLLAAVLLLGCSAASSRTSSQEPKLEVHVINVGQGDAILIRCPEGTHELLIDAAETSRYPNSPGKFKAYLSNAQHVSNTIEVVVATHPHSDHIGNMQWVVEQYKIGLYIDSGMSATSDVYKELMEAITTKGVNRRAAKDVTSAEIDFCPLQDVTARILRPPGTDGLSDPNDRSVVVRVDFKQRSFLFTGDAEEKLEDILMGEQSTKDLLDCDFLKAAHHGSNTSSHEDFLDLVTPKVVAISCGEKGVGTNSNHKHPRYETVRALLSHADAREGAVITIDAYESATKKWRRLKLNTAVYVTVAQGDLVFECDGATIHKK